MTSVITYPVLTLARRLAGLLLAGASRAGGAGATIRSWCTNDSRRENDSSVPESCAAASWIAGSRCPCSSCRRSPRAPASWPVVSRLEILGGAAGAVVQHDGATPVAAGGSSVMTRSPM